MWELVSDQRRARPQTATQGLVGLMAARVATPAEGSGSSGSGKLTSLWANQPRAPITGTRAGVEAIVDTKKGVSYEPVMDSGTKPKKPSKDKNEALHRQMDAMWRTPDGWLSPSPNAKWQTDKLDQQTHCMHPY